MNMIKMQFIQCGFRSVGKSFSLGVQALQGERDGSGQVS
jgi:hypothetical protein